jgi:polysaccharide chain length determinant protein (PEP-CTERM system associated)
MDQPAPKPTESPEFSLGGLEHYTLSDYRRLILRRKWLIAFVALGVALSTTMVTYFLPNMYKGTTTILVDSQRVPENYIKSTVTTSVVDRLATLQEQILSATRLSQVINEMNLYRDLRAKKPQEEIIKRMRGDIEVKVLNLAKSDNSNSMGAFTISFSSRNPAEAARVTNRLASLFIEDNIKAREQQVLGTTSFLDRELEDAKKDLDAQEQKIRDLKTQYASELPESEGVHVQAINSLQLQMRADMDAVNQAQQEKLLIQAQMAELPGVVNLDSAVPPEVVALQALLQQEQGQLDELRQRYGPVFPDVVKKSIEIQELETKIAAAEKSYSQGKKSRAKTAPAAPKNPVLASEIAKLDQDVQKDKSHMNDIQQLIAFHQSKLERIPVFQQQMDALMRNYTVARDQYMHLLNLKFNADMSADLEARQKGERFEILDPAQVPVMPASPNRPLINLAGFVVGIVIGLAVAVGLELIDPTVKTEREIVAELGSTIFGEIPWLPTKLAKRRQLSRAAFAAMATVALFGAYSFLLIWTWKWPA